MKKNDFYLEPKVNRQLLNLYIVSYGDGFRYLKHPYLYDFVIGDLDEQVPDNFKSAMLPMDAHDKVETFADVYIYKINTLRERLKKSIEEKDWDKVSVILPKQSRLSWLSANKDLFEDKKAYYEFLKEAWILTEFPMQSYCDYEDAVIDFYYFDDPRLMMNEEEKRVFDSLPKIVKIYRGIRVDDELDEHNIGLSYTFNKEKAEWFAKRFSQDGKGTPTLIEATIDKDDILSVFLDRDEDEIIVNPDKVDILKITEI